MINRRKFLNSGLFAIGTPLLGGALFNESVANTSNNSTHSSKESIAKGKFYYASRMFPLAHQTFYISHRGVHLKQRVAGENSIESIKLAKRVGFQCVEFDIRLTQDGHDVVIHDDTINRTLRTLDNQVISTPTKVRDLTFDQIRNNYRIHSENKKARSQVPTLEEYLNACNRFQVIPFIEIKEAGRTKENYQRILDLADSICGRENYVITSNNQVSSELRAFGFHDVMVMGILYQTTFEHIQGWKHTFMAISASRFSPQEFEKNVRRSNQENILTESHADTVDKYNMIVKNAIDYISTDLLFPEKTGYGQIVKIWDIDSGKIPNLQITGTFQEGEIDLKAQNELNLTIQEYSDEHLYGVTLEMDFEGVCELQAKNKPVKLDARDTPHISYPILLHKEAYTLTIKALEHTRIKSFRVIVTKF